MIDGTPNRPLYFYQKDIIGNTANWLKQLYFRVWKTDKNRVISERPILGCLCRYESRHWVLPLESNLVAGVRPECLMILPSSKNLKHVRVALGTALGAAWPPTALWCAQRPRDCEAPWIRFRRAESSLTKCNPGAWRGKDHAEEDAKTIAEVTHADPRLPGAERRRAKPSATGWKSNSRWYGGQDLLEHASCG